MHFNNKEKIMSGCAISGILDRTGRRFAGIEIVDSIAVMHERSNGLGAGFAVYGVYPEHREEYAFHLFFDNRLARKEFENILKQYFVIIDKEEVPTGKYITGKNNPPLIWRYFCLPSIEKLNNKNLNEYMAGGRLVLLGLERKKKEEIAGSFIGAGMHGGIIYIRDKIKDYQVGLEVEIKEVNKKDRLELRKLLIPYCKKFDLNINRVMDAYFSRLTPVSSRPYGNLYAY